MLSNDTRRGDLIGGEALTSLPLTMTLPRRDDLPEEGCDGGDSEALRA